MNVPVADGVATLSGTPSVGIGPGRLRRRPARLSCAALFAATLAGGIGAVHGDDDAAAARAAALQRLHWAGLYLSELEIDVDESGIATLSGTVPSDIVREEVVRTVDLTRGIRGVIDRLDARR